MNDKEFNGNSNDPWQRDMQAQPPSYGQQQDPGTQQPNYGQQPNYRQQQYYVPQHQRYNTPPTSGRPYQVSPGSSEPPGKNKAQVSVVIAIVIIMLVAALIATGAFFLIRHVISGNQDSPATPTDSSQPMSESTVVADTTTETTTAFTTVQTTIFESTGTESSATSTIIEEPVDFPNDPYGKIYSQGELSKYSRASMLGYGISPASQASLAYFIDRKAFDAAFLYFGEVALKAEFDDTGEGILHRWEQPVKVEVKGNATVEDLEVLDRIIAELNAIGSLPPVSRVEKGGNYIFTFSLLDDMAEAVSGYVDGNWGFVSIYWDRLGEITSAEAAIAIDVMNQEERNHIILEEFVQGFGLLNDAYDYEESIFQQEWTVSQDLMPIDWAVIRLAYHPVLSSGLDGEAIYWLMIEELFN
ncbi:MAG TPA: DUF2927 domain-containing protein [Clostridiaceae bacterium]|nr:DUF2927 domain-containing protein [Clostridiaceae bacterium]